MKILKMRKIISVCMLIMMVISTISTVTMAITPPSQITASGADNSIKTDTIDKAGKNIISILQAVGVVLSVVVLIVIGIKYMLGSAEQKAEYKKTLMPYIIGAALIFAASMFAQVAYDFFNGWNAGGTGGGTGKPALEAVK